MLLVRAWDVCACHPWVCMGQRTRDSYQKGASPPHKTLGLYLNQCPPFPLGCYLRQFQTSTRPIPSKLSGLTPGLWKSSPGCFCHVLWKLLFSWCLLQVALQETVHGGTMCLLARKRSWRHGAPTLRLPLRVDSSLNFHLLALFKEGLGIPKVVSDSVHNFLLQLSCLFL